MTVLNKTDTRIPLETCCVVDLTGSEAEKLVAMFKALSNPIRLEIIKFLAANPQCITGDIVAYLPIAQATVSQHLKVLKQAGLISGIVQGPATCYCLDTDNIAWFKTKINQFF